jgi:hypothetical protein
MTLVAGRQSNLIALAVRPAGQALRFQFHCQAIL